MRNVKTASVLESLPRGETVPREMIQGNGRHRSPCSHGALAPYSDCSRRTTYTQRQNYCRQEPQRSQGLNSGNVQPAQTAVLSENYRPQPPPPPGDAPRTGRELQLFHIASTRLLYPDALSNGSPGISLRGLPSSVECRSWSCSSRFKFLAK
jgi:hypothetical protein